MLILFFVLFFFFIFSFGALYKYLFVLLLFFELIVVFILFFMVYVFVSNSMYIYLFIFMLVFMVCESVYGLILLIILVRGEGSDYLLYISLI